MTDTPTDVSDLQRRLEAGDCFRVDLSRRTLYLEHVETVGPVMTLTEADGSDAHTSCASETTLHTALRHGEIERIPHDAIPIRGGVEA